MRIAIIVGVIVILLGGGAWYFMQSETDETNTNSETTAQNTDVRSIAQIMEGGDSMKCTFSQNDQYAVQSWTMYVDGQKVRGDYTATGTDVNATPWNGHILSDGEWHYNWGTYQGQNVATKVKLSSIETDVNVNSNTNVQTYDYDQSTNMDCDDWRVDNSLFVPPSDVSFTDLSAQMEQIEAMTNTAQATQCAACDATGDASTRETCRQALGC